MDPNNVPVLFEIELGYGEGRCVAYLHNGELSGHPEEKEYLIGAYDFRVKGVEKKTVHHRQSMSMETTIIRLK